MDQQTFLLKKLSLPEHLKVKLVHFRALGSFFFIFLILKGPLGYKIFKINTSVKIYLTKENLFFIGVGKGFSYNLGSLYSKISSSFYTLNYLSSIITCMRAFQFFNEVRGGNLFLFFGHSHEIKQTCHPLIFISHSKSYVQYSGLSLSLIKKYIRFSMSHYKKDPYKHKGLFFIHQRFTNKKIKELKN